jgi:hypothetical protein
MDLRWGDGLPFVPPTQEVVEEMFKGISLMPDDVIGLLYRGQKMLDKFAADRIF